MNSKWRKNPATIPIVIFMILLALVFIYPLFFTFMNAISTEAQYYTDPTAFPKEIQWNNFVKLIRDFGLLKYFGNTMIVVVFSIALNMLVSVPAAYAFAKFSFRGKNVVYFGIIFAMFFPATVTLIPLYVLFAKLGLLNTFPGLILVTGTGLVPSTMMLLRSYFSGLNNSLFEAAEIDGAGFIRVVWSILMPLAKPILAISAVFNFLVVFNDLLRPMILMQGQDNRTLAVALASMMAIKDKDPTYNMSAMFIASVIPLIVYLIFSKHIVKGVAVGSVK